MADRFPLIVNAVSQKIEELISGDNLELTGNNIVIGGDTGAGKYLTSDGSVVSWGVPGDVYVSQSQTLTNKTLEVCTISGSLNTITNLPNTSLVNSSITVNGTPIPLGGSVSTPNDDTTYAVSMGDGAAANVKKLILTASGSGSGTDEVNFAVGTPNTIPSGSNAIVLAIDRVDDTVTISGTAPDADTITTLQAAVGGTAQSGDITIAATGSSTVSQNPANKTITINSTYVDTITKIRATTGQTLNPGNFTFLDGGATTVSQGVDGNGDSTVTYSSTDTITRLKGGGAGSLVSGDVTLTGGSNVTVSQSQQNITIDSVDTDTVTRLASGNNVVTAGDFKFVATGATSISQQTNSGVTTFTITSTNTDTGASLTASNGIILSSNDFQLKNAGNFTGNTLLKWDSGNSQIGNSLITDNGSTVTISGDLVVDGTQTILNTQTLIVEDNTIELRKGNNLTASNGGLQLNRTTDGSGSVTQYQALQWYEAGGYWRAWDGSVEKRFVTEAETQILTNKTLTSPTLTAPSLGAATATSINGLAINSTASATLDIATSKLLDINDSITFSSGNPTSTVSVNVRQGGDVAYTSDTLATFASTTSTQMRGLITDTTGLDKLVFQTNPTLLTGITTTSVGFNLINTGATAINFGGAATGITIGASTGDTTINHDLILKEDLTVGVDTNDNTVFNGNVNIENTDLVIRGTDTDPMSIGRGGGAVSTNTRIGVQALNANTSGSQNTAVGYQALLTNNVGASNTAIGNRALRVAGVANNNIAIGKDVMLVTLSGSKNVAIGNNAMESNQTGDANVCIGHYAGYDILGSGNVLIGPADNETSADVTFRPPNISGDRQLVIGSGGVAWIRGDSNYDVSVSNDFTVNGDTLIKGNLTVNGTTTTVKSNIVQITDKAIELAAVVSTTFGCTVVSGSSNITSIAPTLGLIPGMVVTSNTAGITVPTGTIIVSITNDTAVLSNNVTGSGTPTFSAIGPSDTAAEDGGIIVKGTSDKTFLWKGVDGGVTYNYWNSSEHINTASGKNYYVNSIMFASDTNKVIGPTNGSGQGETTSNYTLGSAVTGSSLTSLGTLSTFRNDGNAKVAGNTVIDPDSFPASVIAGAIQDGGGWGATGIGGNGSSTGDTWALAHNGAKLYLGMGDGANDNSMETIVQFDPGLTGLVDFTGNRRIKIRSTGLTITDDAAGTYTIDGAHLTIGDSITEGDLQIFHDSNSNNSFISERGTGDLCIVTNGSNLFLQKDATPNSAEDFIHCVANGAVKLYYNGSAAPTYEPCAQTIETNSTKGFLAGNVTDINTSVTHGELIVRKNLASPANASISQCARATIITNEQTGGGNGYGGAVFFGGQDVGTSDQYCTDYAAIGATMANTDLANANPAANLGFFTRNGTSFTEKFRIYGNGNLEGTDTDIGSLSDERLKKNIKTFEYDLEDFKGLKPKTFNWRKPEYHTDTPLSGVHRGFIAQDLEKIDPELVSESPLDVQSEERELVGEDAIAKSAILGRKDAMYVSVIQQLMDKIEVLETKVAQLEGN